MANPFDLIDERLKIIEELLLELKNKQQAKTSNSDEWFDLQQFINYHPDKPAKPTVYEWVWKKSVPYYKRSKKLFFLRSEVDAWLKEGRRKTTKEIKVDAEKYLKKNLTASNK